MAVLYSLSSSRSSDLGSHSTSSSPSPTAVHAHSVSSEKPLANSSLVSSRRITPTHVGICSLSSIFLIVSIIITVAFELTEAALRLAALEGTTTVPPSIHMYQEVSGTSSNV